MELDQIIRNLESATEIERMLDGYIGSVVGWERHVDVFERDGRELRKVTWKDRAGNVGIVPNYSTSLVDALAFASTIAPCNEWACGFSNGKAKATLDGGEPIEAITPAVALCLAAIKFKASSK